MNYSKKIWIGKSKLFALNDYFQNRDDMKKEEFTVDHLIQVKMQVKITKRT